MSYLSHCGIFQSCHPLADDYPESSESLLLVFDCSLETALSSSRSHISALTSEDKYLISLRM